MQALPGVGREGVDAGRLGAGFWYILRQMKPTDYSPDQKPMPAPVLSEKTDEELMALTGGRADAIKKAACAELLKRHGPWVFNLARKMTGAGPASEDIVQEVFIRVWRAAPDWTPKAKFTTWLYRVAVNLCLDEKRKRTFISIDSVEEPQGEHGGREMERRQVAGIVRLRIAELPKRQRAALVLFHYLGHSVAEISELMDATDGAVESLLARARNTLKGKLEGVAGDLTGGE